MYTCIPEPDTYIEYYYGKLKEKDHLRELDVEGRGILKQMIKKYMRREWTEFILFRIGLVVGCL
jgi:hypothetical protein